MTPEDGITPAAIAAAGERIAPLVRETPVMRLEAEVFGLPRPIELKLEAFQHTGSFKVRGALNTLLTASVPAAGVVAASGGNHGIAVAHAARLLGYRARIFVPETSSPVKIAAIRARGAEVVLSGRVNADAFAACAAAQAETGALFVHPYDQAPVIIGQGTLGREWEKQGTGLDTLLVAVGGGGLAAGLAVWFEGRTRVVAVEPEGAPTLHAAMAAGAPVPVSIRSVAGDSLGGPIAGRLPFAIAQRLIEQVVLVSDAAIVAAQTLLWRETRIVAEPGGATALAALTSRAYRPTADERVGVLICGANVALESLTP